MVSINGIGIDNCFNRPGDALRRSASVLSTPADNVGLGHDLEYAGEVFYRFQLTRMPMQFTIGGQLILEPVNNADQDAIGVLRCAGPARSKERRPDAGRAPLHQFLWT